MAFLALCSAVGRLAPTPWPPGPPGAPCGRVGGPTCCRGVGWPMGGPGGPEGATLGGPWTLGGPGGKLPRIHPEEERGQGWLEVIEIEHLSIWYNLKFDKV